MVLVEPDLFFRQFAFHVHKLVLHRATMKAFQDRLRRAGFATAYVETSGEVTSDEQLVEVLREHRVDEVTVFDVVDDWLERDLRRACRAAGAALTVAETPGFLTSRAEVAATFDGVRQPRMQHFYERQRRRLDLLMDGDRPVGGRWSYDTENRRRLPRDIELPALPQSTRSETRQGGGHLGARGRSPTTRVTSRRTTGRPPHRQAETWLNALPRGPVRPVRALRGRDRRRRAVAVPLGAVPAAQHRAARPAARGGARGRARHRARAWTCRAWRGSCGR